MGAKREEIITEKDKRLTAYHEAGHALAAWLTPKADPVHKVTIIPRGRALGVTQFLPEEDRVGYQRERGPRRPDRGPGGPSRRAPDLRRPDRRRGGRPQAWPPAWPG